MVHSFHTFFPEWIHFQVRSQHCLVAEPPMSGYQLMGSCLIPFPFLFTFFFNVGNLYLASANLLTVG